LVWRTQAQVSQARTDTNGFPLILDNTLRDLDPVHKLLGYPATVFLLVKLAIRADVIAFPPKNGEIALRPKKERVPWSGFAMVSEITPASLGHPIFVCVFPVCSSVFYYDGKSMIENKKTLKTRTETDKSQKFVLYRKFWCFRSPRLSLPKTASDKNTIVVFGLSFGAGTCEYTAQNSD